MRSIISVTTAAANRALLPIEDLREAAGLSLYDSSQDYRLDRMGISVADLIAKECSVASDGQNPPTLLRETVTETLRLECDVALLMLARRFVEVVSISEDGTSLSTGDYEVNASAGMISRLRCDQDSVWCARKITVVYRAGFAEAPEDLKLAARRAVAETWSMSYRDPLLKRERTEGLGEDEYWVGGLDAKNGSAFSTQVIDMLAPYRTVRIG